jgi:hypothetical protein
MDFRQLLSDPAVRTEFFDRIDEIAADTSMEDGLEGLEGVITYIEVRDTAESMSEGRWDSSDPGLEAIILRFLRPVYLVQRARFPRLVTSRPTAVKSLGAWKSRGPGSTG